MMASKHASFVLEELLHRLEDLKKRLFTPDFYFHSHKTDKNIQLVTNEGASLVNIVHFCAFYPAKNGMVDFIFG